MFHRTKNIKFELPNRTALIGIDIQEDFIEKAYSTGGFNLDCFLRKFFEAAKRSDSIILTKSSHPADHFSFAEFGPHCIKNSRGARINKKLLDRVGDYYLVTKRSYEPGPPDSYSAFEAETLRPKESVEDILKSDKIWKVIVMGLGHAWEVPQTAFDALALKYDVEVISYPELDPEVTERLREARAKV